MIALAFALSLPAAPLEAAPGPDPKLLAATLKALLRQNLPAPLTESLHGWGHQKESVIGVRWEKKGIVFKPEPMKAVRNDGHWQKVRVDAIDPDKTLSLDVANIRRSPAGTTLFDAAVGLDVRMTYEQQMWAAGRRLYGGETRLRCRAVLRLTADLENKLEFAPGSLIPVVKLRARVTAADLGYQNLVCEHTLGIDGKPAEVVGKAVIEFVKKVKPNLEKDMLAKANAGIVKAADTKEIRIEFDKLLKGKPPAVTREK